MFEKVCACAVLSGGLGENKKQKTNNKHRIDIYTLLAHFIIV
jgi:hypothetical protein